MNTFEVISPLIAGFIFICVLYITLVYIIWMFLFSKLNSEERKKLKPSYLKKVIVFSILVVIILGAGSLPKMYNAVRIKTINEVKLISDAAYKYKISKNEWPASIIDLQNEGYINKEWNRENPWGNSYSLVIRKNKVLISTRVPVRHKEVLQKSSNGVFLELKN